MSGPAWRAVLGSWRGVAVGGVAVVLAAIIVVPALARGTAATAGWWLPATLLIAAFGGALVGLVSIRTYWKRVIDGEPNKPLSTVAALLGLGAGLAFWYGSTGPNGSVPTGVLLFEVLMATGGVGAFLGFLFGIPRFDYSDRLGKSAGQAASVASASPPGTNAAAHAAQVTARYRPSTNLDDIADWLTKIIVGLGLTHLGLVWPGLRSMAHYVASACTPACASEPFVAALIVFSAVAGFLFGYMWTRLHYAKLAARSDVETDETLRRIETVSAAEIGVGGQVKTAVAAAAGALNIDPHKGRFGGKAVAKGRALRAAIEPSETRPGLYRVILTVTSLSSVNPLTGAVTFSLHPTFKERVVTRAVVEGAASLTLVAYGAFTVGAVADGGMTELELDLAEHPDAPDDFRAR